MKKTISTVFTATLGGVIALAASHFVGDKDLAIIDQVRNPELAAFKLVNYAGGAATGNLADFTMAAEKSVNSVVHIKTVSHQVNNLAYDPFAELLFGPQKRQQSFEMQG